jgi:hypothetical protein
VAYFRYYYLPGRDRSKATEILSQCSWSVRNALQLFGITLVDFFLFYISSEDGCSNVFQNGGTVPVEALLCDYGITIEMHSC